MNKPLETTRIGGNLMNIIKRPEGVELPGFSASSRYTQNDRQTEGGGYEIQLPRDAVHSLKRRAQTVRVVSGTAWITLDGDIKDYVVEEGEEMVIKRRRGSALIRAINDSLVVEIL